MIKNRACESVLMRSHKPGVFANTAGNEGYVTPDEAVMLEMHGIAERVQDRNVQQPAYQHREMVAQRPNQQKQNNKHRKG
jgi:hypothetical protein